VSLALREKVSDVTRASRYPARTIGIGVVVCGHRVTTPNAQRQVRG
jgi:hypothetical protein